MKMNYSLVAKSLIVAVVLLSASLFIQSPAFAVYTMEEFQENLEYSGIIDTQIGFDNNANLDSDRKKDGVHEIATMLDFTYQTPLEHLRLIGGVDLFTELYYINNINNFLSTSPYLGFEVDIRPDLVSKNIIAYDHFYTNFSPSNFSELSLSTELRHYFLEDFYHEAGYSYIRRWYPHQPTRELAVLPVAPTATNSIISRTDREDTRYEVMYNIAWMFPQGYVKLRNTFVGNNSNYKYQETYDYWIYRISPSITYYFDEKFYADFTFTYEHWNYKDLRGIDPSNRHKVVRENQWAIDVSAYYDITDQTTFNVTYSYTENNSTDPFLKYSVSEVNAGVSYDF